MSDWLSNFLEKNKPIAYAQDFKGDVCQVMAQAGYVSFHPFAFFPVRGGAFDDMAMQQCREFIVQNGGKNDPYAVMRLTRYTPLINKEDQPNWRDGENSTQLLVGYGNDPDWVKFSAQFAPDGPLPMDKFNRKVWAHVVHVPYPSFVESEPSTHKKFNSWVNNEGKTLPSFLPIVKQLFGSEEEARAWYKDQVVSVPSSSGGSEQMTWREAIEKTMPVPDGWTKTSDDGWTPLPVDQWVSTAHDLLVDMMNQNADPTEYAKQWNGPLTAELFAKLKEIGMKYNPF